MANIKINEIKNTVTDEIIELRTDAVNDSPESITAFKTLRQVVGGCCCWCIVIIVV
ncbi:MAG: hypothetical protein O9276_14170 [Microcystis sp. LE17-20A]|jgi:hypothetical protein|uniref:hypothetical protein n=1 Tax=unclassified Microcystis TaxID=2643300 RepID=UPI0022BEA484|nr:MULTISPECIES: hypothetical protein [unclassified Microcystis]MCZ8039228.1 hypothetical protein [Microcystis sp. LE17-20A]MCZ8213566.1 hypothetical protein [Microcystis sp. LE19-8.1F]